VDGVLTDGGLYLSDSGEEFKRFNSLDGHGLKMLKASGLELAIITGRTSKCVELRARNLGIARLYQGVEDKLAAMQALLAELKLAPEATAFMGDDVVDLPVMRRRLALSVPAAPRGTRPCAFVSQREAGNGAVREVRTYSGRPRHAGRTTPYLSNENFELSISAPLATAHAIAAVAGSHLVAQSAGSAVAASPEPATA
jgi:3-deoxy-D-manno-octulosonate 8-phosphate phosphatase (KDO 8-P phosphatase)